MLKALELSGFKSFADKTRFEFPPGITVVVGPNGSGKSNIVDALKWVLGEQSAKSLRGKDMSDVIFKGSSGAGSRKPAGAASVTLYLDNSDGRLINDAPEVSVTRRVYRSGESEYLINGAPCRLKDIRDLFRGTGIGTDAYSLIEQGKVERMLQASAKDRRAIFEEAAGISRFKAKKTEAERRLERVQGNLVRLADIVEEVGSRYRAVKNQASRAARYRELTARLQELRVFVGTKDYRALEQRTRSAEEGAAAHAAELATQEQLLAAAQELTATLEHRLDGLTGEINRQQESVSAIRDESVQLESRIEAEQRRRADLCQRIAQNQSQLAAHDEKLSRLRLQAEAVDKEARAADADFLEASGNLESAAGRMQETESGIARHQTVEQQQRERFAALQSEEQGLSREVGNLTAQLDAARREYARHQNLHGQLTDEVARTAAELEQLLTRRSAVTQEAELNDTALRSARESVESLEEMIAARQQVQGEQKSALAGLVQRAKVISELERKMEHANAGNQTLLRMGREDKELGIAGMVADLIQVNVRHAALIDAALGPVAQFIVTRDDTLIQKIAIGELRIPGRVGILPLQRPASPIPQGNSDPTDLPGVVGPAGSLIESVGAGYAGLVGELLGRTWIAQSLAAALALRANGWTAIRFVTLDGEILEVDGTVVAGARTAAQGIVSRRSELRALAGEQAALEQDVAAGEQTLDQLRKELASGRRNLQKLLTENQQVSQRLGEISAAASQLEKQQERQLGLHRQQELELAELAAASAGFLDALSRNRTQQESRQAELAELGATLDSSRLVLEKLAAEQAEASHQLMVARVRLARAEQQRLDFGSRRGDLQRQFAESAGESEQTRSQVQIDEAALAESIAAVESAESRRGELAVLRESASDALQTLVDERSRLEAERKQQALALNRARTAARQAQEQLGECRIRASQYQLERNQLAERLREDYQIDVAGMVASETPEQAGDREKIDLEIGELRQKIGALGSVNLQALADLEELEQRYQLLDGQYQDLAAARDSLLKIIHRINNDSRKLFVETLDAIRQNFQKLFRQTFGGGQADIVLEEGVDVLEAGVEIIATPPGKPKFNNSLLSGGERALTAVSLLMAIFQFRPSPFCVLDEVDAPFDEANIGRFIEVLRSFLGWTRFVIVTHSKKTMTAATTLYGVTMQESGVSKRVSVRFEDVSEDGQIAKSAPLADDPVPEEGEDDSPSDRSGDGQRTVA